MYIADTALNPIQSIKQNVALDPFEIIDLKKTKDRAQGLMISSLKTS